MLKLSPLTKDVLTILCLFVVVFGGYFGPVYLHAQGMCISEWRVLSEEEKIRNIVLDANNRSEIAVPETVTEVDGRITTNYVSYPYVPYKSVEDFLKENPECCAVIERNVVLDKGSSPPTILDLFFGDVSDYIQGEYIARYLDKKGNVRTFKRLTGGDVYLCGELYKN